MSQTGDFMVVFTPRGSLLMLLIVGLKDGLCSTLAHGGRFCQARAAIKQQNQAASISMPSAKTHRGVWQ
jgi:hypothetical protein